MSGARLHTDPRPHPASAATRITVRRSHAWAGVTIARGLPDQRDGVIPRLNRHRAKAEPECSGEEAWKFGVQGRDDRGACHENGAATKRGIVSTTVRLSPIYASASSTTPDPCVPASIYVVTRRRYTHTRPTATDGLREGVPPLIAKTV